MSDFPVLKFISLIPVTSVDFIDNTSLKISGADVRPTIRALVNGVDCPDVVVLSLNDVAVTIPTSEVGKVIRSVTLVGASNVASTINFSIKDPNNITDSVYVLQKFMRLLLMDRGSDIFYPDMGVGLFSRVGSLNFEDVEVTLSSLVFEAGEQLKSVQSISTAESKLLSVVDVTNVSYSINNLTVSLTLKLIMQDGSSVETDFNLSGN